MIALALLSLLGQAPCPAVIAEASARAEEFDLAGAADRLSRADAQGCMGARVAALYITGLVDAREAFRQGAPPAALAPVRGAIAELEKMSGNRPGQAEIARLLLQAAAAGAQSERGEMALYLDAAAQMEALQRAANQPGAPIVSSLELAGDLWLQLFGYREARDFYGRAIEQGPETMRAREGLARASARVGVETAACLDYQALIKRWGARTAKPPEIADAETYLQRPVCRSLATR